MFCPLSRVTLLILAFNYLILNLIARSKTKVEIPRVMRSKKEFPTGSSYVGEWDIFGMSGKGRYMFPYDVVYEGEFMEGMFHGKGKMIYPCGGIVKGTWDRGELKEHTIVFADNVEYASDGWKYCTMPDRRFSVEYQKGLQPAGRSFKTNQQPTRQIPKGCYDTVDGFYNPVTGVVCKQNDPSRVLRVPLKLERDWIEANCRKGWDEVVGPRPDLYEKWCDPIEQKFQNRGLSGKAFSFEPCKAFKVASDSVENPCPCDPCKPTDFHQTDDKVIPASRADSKPAKTSVFKDDRDKCVKLQVFPKIPEVTVKMSTIRECACEVEPTESKSGQRDAWQKIVDSRSEEVFRNVMHGTMSSLEEEEKQTKYKQVLIKDDLNICTLCSEEDERNEEKN